MLCIDIVSTIIVYCFSSIQDKQAAPQTTLEIVSLLFIFHAPIIKDLVYTKIYYIHHF